MSVYGSDQAGISTIQKSRRGLQFPQSKRGAARKEEALPKLVIHKVTGALERKEKHYFSRFALEEKKLAAIKEEIRKERYRRERRGKEVTKPLTELDIEEPRIRQNILNLTSKFEQSGELELLDLIESKKYAREKEKKEWLAKIDELEEKYYEDIPPIPEGLMKPLMEQPPMPMKKARETLSEFKELVNERNLDEKVIKSFVKMLEISITQE